MDTGSYRHIRVLLVPFIVLLFTAHAQAQNLEEIKLKKGIEASGSIHLNTIAYAAHGIQQRRDPFNWFASGNLNLNLFGYAAPFSFSYSNMNKSYSQPFNQFHFAPQYKWIKTYTGNTSMSFSPYTLAGHTFLGGGVELTPGYWRISVMYGRLKKAVPFSPTDSLQNSNAAFKRMGYGLKVAYEKNGTVIGSSFFSAKDDPNSIPFVFPSGAITPQQNVAASLNVRKKIFSRFFIDVEYGLSVLNTNTWANSEAADSVKQSKNLLLPLLPANTTTRYFDAVSAAVGYQGKQYNVHVKYERIAPEYQTLGAYYFNNDMRNITVITNARLFSNKLTLGSNIGFQKNNLDNTRAATSNRVVAAFQVQMAPSPHWNASANYSNFSSYTRVRPPSDPFFREGLDTLNFYQVSETMNGSVSYIFGRKDSKQSIALNGSFQQASNAAAGSAPPQLSDFLNGSLSYGCSLAPSNLTLSVALTASTNNVPGVTTSFFGPAVSASKSMLQKTLKASWSASYSKTRATGAFSSPVWSSQLNFAYSPTSKKQEEQKESRNKNTSRNNFGLNTNVLRRLKRTGTQGPFTEVTMAFNYSYTF